MTNTAACFMNSNQILHDYPFVLSCIYVSACISGDITTENVRSKSLQREMDTMINDLQNVLWSNCLFVCCVCVCAVKFQFLFPRSIIIIIIIAIIILYV
jgi:hypothetical protein